MNLRYHNNQSTLAHRLAHEAYECVHAEYIERTKTESAAQVIFHDMFVEKFAELIVRECAELTLDYKNEAHYNGWLDHCDTIKKHFKQRVI